jgi:hypothetical protein
MSRQQRDQHPVVVYDVDPSAPDDSPVYLRSHPLKLLTDDIGRIILNLPQFINILTSWPGIGTDITFCGLVGQGLLFVVTVLATIICIVANVFPLGNLAIGGAIGAVVWSSNWLQGPARRLDSGPDNRQRKIIYQHETWLL